MPEGQLKLRAKPRVMKGKLLLLFFLNQAVWAQDLHQMVRNSTGDRIRQRAAEGADLNQQDVNGDTPLHWAIAAGRPEIAKLLLELGSRPDLADHGGRTPLYRAAEAGQTEVAAMLLERGARPEGADLRVACLYNRPQVVDLLLKSGADADAAEESTGLRPMHEACIFGSIQCLELLMKAGARVDVLDARRNLPLHQAALAGGQMCVETLLQAGLDPDSVNDSQETPLMLAISRDHHQLADYLAGRSQLTHPVLETATQAGYLSVLRRAAEPPSELLSVAAARGRMELVEYLLGHGVPVDSPGHSGLSAYLAAAGTGRRDLMERLLQAGADPTLRGPQGQSAADLVQAHIALLKSQIQMEDRKRSASLDRPRLEEELKRSQATLLWLQEG